MIYRSLKVQQFHKVKKKVQLFTVFKDFLKMVRLLELTIRLLLLYFQYYMAVKSINV